MKKLKSETDFLTKKAKKKAVETIINYFETERDEKIGFIAAENILNMFLDEIGFNLYNKGVEDTQKLIKEEHEQILIDIEALVKKHSSLLQPFST